jgi:hypothetical protein
MKKIYHKDTKSLRDFQDFSLLYLRGETLKLDDRGTVKIGARVRELPDCSGFALFCAKGNQNI